jgi:2-polyprenyl-3-methyl-5-hydroxy-6-metoxy-1,4-benzoquinol methylase
MQQSSKDAVIAYLKGRPVRSVLDAPCGDGWLQAALPADAKVDGIDLYAQPEGRYHRFWQHDLDTPLPKDCGTYDLICCCEGLEHLGNPLLFLREVHRRLADDGLLIVTTPNVWYPQARLQFLHRGFFPSFPALEGKVVPGTHMHITPWSYPQLYAYLRLAGFKISQILPEQLSQAKHLHERLLAWPARIYCRGREKRASTDEARAYWQAAGSDASLLGRHLSIAAVKA